MSKARRQAAKVDHHHKLSTKVERLKAEVATLQAKRQKLGILVHCCVDGCTALPLVLTHSDGSFDRHVDTWHRFDKFPMIKAGYGDRLGNDIRQEPNPKKWIAWEGACVACHEQRLLFVCPIHQLKRKWRRHRTCSHISRFGDHTREHYDRFDAAFEQMEREGRPFKRDYYQSYPPKELVTAPVMEKDEQVEHPPTEPVSWWKLYLYALLLLFIVDKLLERF